MGCGCFLRTFFNTSFLPSLSSCPSCPSTTTIVTRTRRIVARTVLVHGGGAWLRASRQRAPIMMTGARKPWQPAVQAPSHQLEGSISEGGEGGRQGAFDSRPKLGFFGFRFHPLSRIGEVQMVGWLQRLPGTKIALWSWSTVDSPTHGHFALRSGPVSRWCCGHTRVNTL